MLVMDDSTVILYYYYHRYEAGNLFPTKSRPALLTGFSRFRGLL